MSTPLAEKSALQGIGKIPVISPVHLRVTLRRGDHAQSFSFSRTWTAPSTVLHLRSCQLALLKLAFQIKDDDLECEDLFIGRPVLHHLKVDTKTLLESNRSVLDGAYCSEVGNPTTETEDENVHRLMGTRANHIQQNDQTRMDLPRVNCYTARTERDPFPDPPLL